MGEWYFRCEKHRAWLKCCHHQCQLVPWNQSWTTILWTSWLLDVLRVTFPLSLLNRTALNMKGSYIAIMKEVFHLVYYPWSPRVICIKILSCQLLCSFDSRPPKKKPTGCSGWDTSQTKIRYSCNVLKAGTLCTPKVIIHQKHGLKHENFHQSLWRMRAGNPTNKEANSPIWPHPIK